MQRFGSCLLILLIPHSCIIKLTDKIATYRVLSFLGVTICFHRLSVLSGLIWIAASEETERQLRTGKWEDEACGGMDK